MQCPQCQHENREGAKFCNECATPLSLRCPSCETLNPPGAKFCDECTTFLTTSTTAPNSPRTAPQPATQPERDPASYAPHYLAEKILTSRSALQGERKQVTVMFADIKDSTQLIRDLDPEAAQSFSIPPFTSMWRQRGALTILLSSELGEIYLLAGRLDDASQCAMQALERSRAQDTGGYQAYALRLLGDITMHRNPPDVDQAKTHYRQSLDLANELGMRPLLAHCHRGLGTLYHQTGQPEQSRVELSTAIDMYCDMEMTFWLPNTEAALAKVEKR